MRCTHYLKCLGDIKVSGALVRARKREHIERKRSCGWNRDFLMFLTEKRSITANSPERQKALVTSFGDFSFLSAPVERSRDRG